MSIQNQPVYIVSATRTAVGKARGVFANTLPDDLLVTCIKGLLSQVKNFDPNVIDDVIIGCAMPEGEQGMNIARIATLLADLPQAIPALTINRFCSSGLQTIAMAAERIWANQADVILAGGVESMTMVPLGGNHYTANPAYFSDEGQHQAIAYNMGITAEKVAQKWQVSREMQDEFAFNSHQKALQAMAAGHFNDEITTVTTMTKVANHQTFEIEAIKKVVANDEGPRADTSLAALNKLRTVFAAKGSVTAGNSSQVSDGAGLVMVASERAVKQYKLTPMARFCGFSVAGVAPEHMGIGPVAAIPKVLKQVGIKLEAIDWIELNEAFAAQSLAVMQDLKLDPQKVNPYGGAIALGHPLGATGAIRSATLLHGLSRNKLRYGMVTMCIGTGMGAAGIFECLQR